MHDYVSPVIADTFRLQVKDLNFAALRNPGLIKACVNIHHQRTSDLKLTLIAPSGASIWLSNRNGGEDGQNYTETCFSQNGFFGYIHQGQNPFYGDFIPDGRFEILNEDTAALAGEWLLVVQDLRNEFTGFLGSWNLYFGELPTIKTDWCGEDQPEACVTAPENEAGLLLPDLVLLPAFTRNQFTEYPCDHDTYPGQIKFAATIANIGWGPMETRGSDQWYCGGTLVEDGNHPCEDGSYPRQVIVQRVYAKRDGEITFRDTVAGTNYFDAKPGHNHYHVDDWVEYKLLKINDNKEEVVICQGEKVSYCLFDSGSCQENDPLCEFQDRKYGPQNLPNYGFGRYVSCYEGIQGISVGGYDTYGSMYEGQSLTLPAGTGNGHYILQITVDPNNIYLEENEDNNVLRLEIDLIKQSL